METVNIGQAKAHLSRLVAQVARGDSVVLAKAGKPIARIVPLSEPDAGKIRRLGFLKGQLQIPDDFDRMHEKEIEALFNGQV